MDESTKRRWDVRLGIVAPTLTVVAILVGVWQFVEGQNSATRLEYKLLARQSEIDFRRQLWTRQLENYQTIAEIAGSIAANHDRPAVLEDLSRKFLEMYWGAMIFVEDDEVEQAMIDFFHEVHDYQTGWGDADKLKIKASSLVSACRASSDAGWKRITDYDQAT